MYRKIIGLDKDKRNARFRTENQKVYIQQCIESQNVYILQCTERTHNAVNMMLVSILTVAYSM
jgi:phosphoribosylpyrophosphate synthetase